MINNTMTPQFIGYISDFINWDNGNNTIRITLTTPVDPGSPAGWELIDDIREKVSELFDYEDVEGAYVTGMSAMFKDSKDEMYVNVPQMLLLAVVLIFLALLVLFRSIVLPIKAILTISGSILFALGSLVMVFEYGWFNDVTIAGYQIWSAEVVGITYFLPVFLFTTILGLGMDYSILIISRIKEEYDKTGDMDEAVGTGLAKTAGVITSAATVMVATFLVFAGAPMLILKMMGMAMAIAIVVDATISRIILLPAAMKLLGKQNWWLPKWLDKILPRLDLEH
ncbi:MAG: MMPL family transporter [Candidatus Heimdallarchaeota archaeon]|nr:MMPL family transporter [Candidatus Heimdallarchaeota archaeon]